MRTCQVLAAAVLLALTGVACGDASDGLQSSRSLRRSSPIGANEHGEDMDGADSTDPGNPNAAGAPGAPTTQGTAARDFSVLLDNVTPVAGLGDKLTIVAKVTPVGGFTGPVTLTVTGLPAGVTAPTANVTVGAGPAQAQLTLDVGYSAIPMAGTAGVPLVVTARAGAEQATANANFKVAPKVTVTIPMNVDALRGAAQVVDDYGAAFGPNAQPLLTQAGNGIVVSVFNADSKAHVIHGDGAFPHGNDKLPIQPNAFEMTDTGAVRTRTLAAGTDRTPYLHDGDDGRGASFRIRVAAAAP